MTTVPVRRARVDAADAAVVGQTRKLLTQHGLDGDARRMGRHLSKVRGLPTIVVVGEVRRGKSSLVNALVGAEICPIDGRPGSEQVIALVPASDELALGRAELLFADRREQRPVHDAWAGLSHEGGRDQPLGCRIAVASTWVPGISLVDTPGVGGMQASRLLSTRAAAEEGTAVLFVADGAQPLTAAELAFLAELSADTERIVLALTKIDRNPGAWEEVRADNLRLLKRHAPRLAGQTFHATSAAYALHALQQPGEVAEALDQASGIPALAREIGEVAAGGNALALANALRVGRGGLERLEDTLDQQLALVEAGPAAVDVSDERDRLNVLRRDQRRSRFYLERDVTRIRHAAVDLVSRRAEEVTSTLTRRVSDERKGTSDAAKTAFAHELGAALAALASEVEELMATQIEALLQEYLGPRDTQPDELPLGVQAPAIRARVRERAQLDGLGGLDPANFGAVMMGGNLLGTVGGPLGFVLGGAAMVGLNARVRGTRQGQQALMGTLNDTMAGARADLVAGVDAWLRELRPELLIAVEDRLADEVTQVRTLIAQAERVQQQDALERRSQTNRLELRRDAVKAKRLALERRLRELTGPEHSAVAGAPTTTKDAGGNHD